MTVTRMYLSVPPEENPQVEALGARRDRESMCWYIDAVDDPAKFSKWMQDELNAEFRIVSDDAYVALTAISCWSCHFSTDVICIYCESGSVSGERLSQFTVSHVWALDGALQQQLGRWPFFRECDDPAHPDGGFANHCQHCGAVQDDLDLHTEPDHPFFGVPSAAPGSIQLEPRAGRIQLSGDESFEI
jgi:hypothetical protein